ncbi:hypothetical protein D3C71_1137230 [compost metagenome]
MTEVVAAARLHHAIEQSGPGAPLGNAVLLVSGLLRMKTQGWRVQGRQKNDTVGEDDAVAVKRMFHVPEQTFLFAPALHEMGIGLVELGDVGQQRIFP